MHGRLQDTPIFLYGALARPVLCLAESGSNLSQETVWVGGHRAGYPVWPCGLPAVERGFLLPLVVDEPGNGWRWELRTLNSCRVSSGSQKNLEKLRLIEARKFADRADVLAAPLSALS